MSYTPCGWCGYHARARNVGRCTRCKSPRQQPVSSFAFIQWVRFYIGLDPLPHTSGNVRRSRAA